MKKLITWLLGKKRAQKTPKEKVYYASVSVSGCVGLCTEPGHVREGSGEWNITLNDRTDFRDNGVPVDAELRISDKHFPNAMALVLRDESPDSCWYATKGAPIALAFCRSRIRYFFGEIPSIIWWKEVNNA